MLEPAVSIEGVVHINAEEAPLAIEAIPDVEILSSDDGPLTYAGTSGIADRVRERKGTEIKAAKPPIKRKLNIPTLLSRDTKKIASQDKTDASVPSENSDDEDIHGKSLL